MGMRVVGRRPIRAGEVSGAPKPARKTRGEEFALQRGWAGVAQAWDRALGDYKARVLPGPWAWSSPVF